MILIEHISTIWIIQNLLILIYGHIPDPIGPSYDWVCQRGELRQVERRGLIISKTYKHWLDYALNGSQVLEVLKIIFHDDIPRKVKDEGSDELEVEDTCL
jgi:hypothetical protein